MITFSCDKCEKMLEVDDEQAGRKVKCPFCGDVNQVPVVAAAAGTMKAPDRAAAAGYPPAHGPEVDVLTIRPAMLRSRPLSFVGLACGLLIGGGLGAWFYFVQHQSVNGAICFSVAGISGLLLVVWRLTTLDAGMRITTKRTVERRGLLSRSTTEVLHADIRNVQIEQTFWERIWNVGTLSISCAAEHENEIQMKNVPRPQHVRTIVDLYRPI